MSVRGTIINSHAKNNFQRTAFKHHIKCNGLHWQMVRAAERIPHHTTRRPSYPPTQPTYSSNNQKIRD